MSDGLGSGAPYMESPSTTTGLVGTAHGQAWIVTALAVIGTVVLAALNRDIPQILVALDGGGIGAASALSLPTR